MAAALAEVDPNEIKAQVAALVPKDAQVILATNGIRDEHVFPVPAVLRKKPTLLAYYRLLLGQPRKAFYEGSTGCGPFQSMESTDRISPKQEARLDELIGGMIGALADLVRQMSPTVTPRDIDELPLLTLGQQFLGANNNVIEQTGT